MRATLETAKLTRYVITDRGESRESEYGDWVDAQEALLLVEQLQDLCRKYKGIAGACPVRHRRNRAHRRRVRPSLRGIRQGDGDTPQARRRAYCLSEEAMANNRSLNAAKTKKLKDKKYPRAARRYTYQWLAEAENFTLIYAALDTAYRAFRSQAHHASMGSGTAPGRFAAKKLQRRYGNIMLHLREILKA